ncbi:SDR family NAD(P)-dependent oxidoreductase [Vineibacter terrae]|uniref:SDR family NAD(P)-dependent oxidoreductase n=1 Tax=Vineibacter terrae TaxID=2586908 RepID=UPI002E373C02|nr:SDR family NAD(P)-dependent oxidoreductase [Vineibacter terrae]HEX2887568.1 SDR family NAD(P)-dependent oxidoreductase [Vineibacter terrae]
MADLMDLAGRRVLVTGAASGIGRATADLFIARGARVALLDRDPAVAAVPGATVGLAVDVADEAAVAHAVNAAAAALDGLDGVVNSAGIDLVKSITDMTPAEWNRLLGVNLNGPFHVCRAAAPFLRAAPEATVVNVASGAGLVPLRHRTAYCASKAGLVMFTKSLAMELAPVRVNAFCPGIIDTPLFRLSFENEPDPDAELRRILDRYLIKRAATPEEAAHVVLFLSSRASSIMTGVALAGDAGRTFH